MKLQQICCYFWWSQFALTDLQIRRTGKPGNYTDGRGLFLQVAPTGGKYWRYAYRFGGKQKTLALRYIP